MYWFNNIINSVKIRTEQCSDRDVGRLQLQGSVSKNLIISTYSASDTLQMKTIPNPTVI